MRAWSCFLVCGLLSFFVVAQPFPERPQLYVRLTGIIDLPNQKEALLEVQLQEFVSLAEGKEWNGIEVEQIDRLAGTVVVRQGEFKTTLTLQAKERDPAENLFFDGIKVSQLVNVFSDWTGRTVICSPRVRDRTITGSGKATSNAQGAKLIEEFLAKQKISVVRHDAKLVFIVPKEEEARLPDVIAWVTEHALEYRQEGETKPGEIKLKPGEIIPVIVFENMPLMQAVDFYGSVVRRKILDPGRLPSPMTRISFRGQGGLTREEAIFGLEALLALHNFKVNYVGEKNFEVVQIKSGKDGGKKEK